MGFLVTKKKLASLVWIEKKSQRVENLVKKYNHKTYISFTPNFLVASSSILIYYSSNFLATTFV